MRSIGVSILVLISVLSLGAQTNPAPQNIPYAQDFSSLAWASTVYPDGMQGWVVSTTPGSTFSTSAPTGNRSMQASSTTASPAGGVHNYNGRMGFLNTNSLDLSIMFSVNASGKENIQLNYSIMTIRNPYGYLSSNRINEVVMQYRVGVEGSFTNLAGTEYQNNTVQKIDGSPTPQNPQSKSITLPTACNDQSIVQLRLISRWVSGTGTYYPSFAIDNIQVTGENVHTPVELTNFTIIQTGDKVRVQWVSQSETGLLGYRVYRSDQNELSPALSVSPLYPATNTSQMQTYAFDDIYLYEPGRYYYWLESAELDGSSEFHGPINIYFQPADTAGEPVIPIITGIAAYPNPFNPNCTIEYSLADASVVSFSIFNLRGQLVWRSEPKSMNAGSHSFIWQGRDECGRSLPSGVYLLRMDTGRGIFQSRLVLLK